MDDSELFNLTVVELRSLCNERGLEAAKLRKKQIVELLVDNGVSEIPENLKNRSTPRKSVMTPVKSSITTRRSVLTPQKKQSDPNSTVTTESTKLTPRKARYQRFQQLAQLKESKRSNKENVRENVETETPEEADEEPTEKVTPASQDEEKEEEFSDAKEHLPSGVHGDNRTEEEEASTSENDEAAEENEVSAEEDGAANNENDDPSRGKEDAGNKLEEAAKESEDAGSVSSFTTAASPTDSTTPADKDDDGGSATPRKSRKRWSTSITGEFNFARQSQTPEVKTTTNDENMGSPSSSPSVEAEESEQPPDSASNKDSPERPRLTRQRTFTVETPASKATPGVSNASKVGFKASKTPNFKKIHERNQAKFEDIAAYSARRRDRMRQLLSSTREIRTAGAASRDAAQTPKTPMRTVKGLAQMETPASERKILSNKVRSNRRFELLMKARGLPIDGENSEDH